jgi:pimeloyl-ACP methyl ester carboxylesterase
MKYGFCVLGAGVVSAAVLLGGAVVSAAIPEGMHEHTVELRGTPVQVYTYRPRSCAGPSLLLAFHGSERNPALARESSRGLADRHCLLVLAPYFDAERFPLWRYQQGGMVEDRRIHDRGDWTGHLALELVKWARREEGRPAAYALIGHSAGAQFLARLAAFIPNEATRIVLANPANHVFPTLEADVPRGFRGVYSRGAEGEAALKRYLAQPITIFVGEQDLVPDPGDSADTMAQGKNRYERGINAYNAGRRLADQKGWPFNWRLVRVPGVGHSSKAMYGSREASAALAP